MGESRKQYMERLWNDYQSQDGKFPLLRDVPKDLSREHFEELVEFLGGQDAKPVPEPKQFSRDPQKLEQNAETARKAAAQPATDQVRDVVQAELGRDAEPEQQPSSVGGKLDKFQYALDAVGAAEPTPFADSTNMIISLVRPAPTK